MNKVLKKELFVIVRNEGKSGGALIVNSLKNWWALCPQIPPVH